LSISLGLAVYFIGTRLIKSETVCNIFVIGIFMALSFLTVMSINASDENHIFAPVSGNTQYYTQSEMKGSEFIAKNTNGVISSDYRFGVGDSSSVFLHAYGIDLSRLKLLDTSLNTGVFYKDGSIKIIRESNILDMSRKGYLYQKIQPNSDNYLFSLGYNKIFDNQAMSGYVD